MLRSPPSSRRALAILLVTCVAAAVPSALLAHAELTASNPAAGAQLAAPPSAIRLTFSEAATPAFSKIELVGSTGAPIALGALAVDTAKPLTLVASVPSPLPPGTYTVRWRAVAVDGHPSRGTFTFRVLAPAPGAANTPAPAPPPAPPPAAAPAVSSSNDSATRLSSAATEALEVNSPVFVALRAVSYAAVLGLIGAAFLVLLLLSRLRSLGLGSDAFAEDAGAGALKVARLSAALLVVAAPLKLAAFAASISVSWTAVVGGSSLWGRAWLLQLAGSLLAAGALTGARIGATRWRVAGIGAIAIAIAWALSGHAAAATHFTTALVLADAIHLIAAGAWIGTLAAVVLAGLAAAFRVPEGARGQTAAALVDAFSPLALFSAGLLAATGAFAAWEHLGSLGALVNSAYGKTLLVKLAAVALLAVVGAVNWRLLRPKLGTEEAARGIRRSAMRELGIALIVILITAVLVATPTPKPRAANAAPAMPGVAR